MSKFGHNQWFFARAQATAALEQTKRVFLRHCRHCALGAHRTFWWPVISVCHRKTIVYRNLVLNQQSFAFHTEYSRARGILVTSRRHSYRISSPILDFGIGPRRNLHARKISDVSPTCIITATWINVRHQQGAPTFLTHISRRLGRRQCQFSDIIVEHRIAWRHFHHKKPHASIVLKNTLY